MAAKIQTQELLEELMAGQVMTPEKLDNLLENKVSEDLFLEYKHADELKDGKKANHTIRQYLSGFANSAGGVLIIGVDEKSWKVTPCTTEKGDLKEWAARCLNQIAHYFSPPPRFETIDHSKGQVLVAVTSRSLNLVPCKEKEGLVYYLRFHDQTLNNKTLKIPEYLISDLVLGRRQRPYLHLRQLSLNLKASEKQQYNSRLIGFRMNFLVENESLAWANEVRLGIVRQILHPPMSLSNHLMSFIDVRRVKEEFFGDHEYNLNYGVVSEQGGLIIDLDPFSVVNLGVPGNVIPVRILNEFYRYTWHAAVYVMSKESPPIWYQIQLKVNDQLLKIANEEKTINSNDDFLKITRLVESRPVVSWEGFGEMSWS